MNEGKARQLIFFSLILSSISFLLSLIAFFLPYWKFIQLRSSISSSMFLTEYHQMDPLILGELDKYTEILYSQDLIHSFGLNKHCINGKICGYNLLLFVNQTNYKYCHHMKYHYDCIFSSTMSDKCHCQKPAYIQIISILFIFIFILKIFVITISFIRSSDHEFIFLKDLHLRILTIIFHFFLFIFILIILIEQHRHRSYEPLHVFRSMHRYYSDLQIYSFANNLELILEKIQTSLDIQFGASYTCTIFIFIFIISSFLLSATIEVKRMPSDEEEIERTPEIIRRAIPSSSSEPIRLFRQTKV